MNCNDFSFERLKEIPVCHWDKEDKEEYNAVIIVPMPEMHESGYRCMTYLFCKGEEIICRNNGYSDVLHIDGIGGYGDLNQMGMLPTKIEPRGWSIDCLPNGYLRLFSTKGKIKNGNGLSDYEIYGK